MKGIVGCLHHNCCPSCKHFKGEDVACQPFLDREDTFYVFVNDMVICESYAAKEPAP